MSAWKYFRKFTKYCFYIFAALGLLLSGLLWYVTTDSFQNMVRARLVAAIERATGGRAELGSFHVVPLRFQVEVRNLTVHGREAAGQAPLVHIDSMSAIVDVSSVLGAKIAFHSLTLRHPVVHVILYPDRSTNTPEPRQTATNFEQLLAFRIDRLDVEQGELLWQDQPIPLQFVTNDISSSLQYSFLHRRYSGDLSIGKAETRFQDMRPLAWAANARFSIGSESIEIGSLTLTSEGSRLQLKGVTSNFRNPVFKGSYDLLLDLPQVAAVAHDAQFKLGTLELKGDGSWSKSNFAGNGLFSLNALAVQNKTVNVKDVSAAGSYSFDPQKIGISRVAGRAFAGNFTLEGESVNWQSPGTRSRFSKEQQKTSLKFKLKDVSLSELLASLGTQFAPFNQLKFGGDVSGNSEVRWTGSIRNAEIAAALAISKPARESRNEIPLNATLQGNYDSHSGVLRFENLSASTAATQLHSSGALFASTPLQVSFTTSDLREWQPLTTALFPRGMPFAVHGRTVFNGSVIGSMSHLSLAGNLQAQDFDTTIPETATANAHVHWDSLATDLQLSSRSLALHNSVLRNGDATVKLDGNVGLVDWNLVPTSQTALRVHAENVDAAQLLKIAGERASVRGQLNADGSISGTISKPEAQGAIRLSNGAFQDHPFDNATATVQFQGSQVSFKKVHVTRGAAEISGLGAYDFAAQTIQLDLSGTNVDVSEFDPLDNTRLRLGGKFDFSAQASGSLNEPDVRTHVNLRNLTLNDETAGNYVFDAVTHGADLKLTGKSDFENAELLVDGSVHLRGLWPARINLHFTRLDIDSLIETYLRAHVTGHSAVAGDLILSGPLRRPEQLNLTGTLTDFFADVDDVELRNREPVRFSLDNQSLRIDSFHLLGTNTDFSGSGSIQLNGEHSLNLKAQGAVGLQLLQAYNPDITASGTLAADASVTGTWDRPQVKGKLQIKNGAVTDVNLPSALTEMNGTLFFVQNEISVQDLSGRIGGGTVNFTGQAHLSGKQISFDLTANADAVRLRYPPGVSSTATAVLRWNGSSAGSLLSGDITVNKLGVTPGFDFGAYLEKTVEAASLPQTDPVLNNIRLDLHVVTAPELQMQTSVLRLRGEADLRVRGNAAKPVLLGRADVFEGEASFGGTKYRLERGGVTFSNPAVTTPFLDLEATTRVRDYDITLSMTGPADKPKLNYRSEPPLPTSDIITLLAFGQTTETSAQLQQTNQSVFSSQASSAMLTAALNATLNNRTSRLFGGSSIKIDPQGLEAETSPTQTGPAVTIEQQVRDNITVAYTTDVAQTSQQVIRAEYNVSKNVSVIAIRDQYGVVSFDVQIRRRKR